MANAISIIIPAGGRSERMGTRNKLLLPLGDQTVLEHVVEAALGAGPLEVILVTGSGRGDVERAVAPLNVRCVYNPEFEEGMASALRTGIEAASSEAQGYAILLADLPFVQAETIRLLTESLTADRIVVPRYRGARGHPVLFGSRFRSELLTLEGDVGGRSVLEAHSCEVVLVDVTDPGTVRDIDTKGDYEGSA